MNSGSSETRSAAGRDLMGRVLALMERGETPDVNALAAEFSEDAGEIRQLIAVLGLVRDVASPPAGARLDVHARGASGVPTLGDFRILRELGRGGMGAVYEAEQISLGRRVALKVLLPGISKHSLERFEREARTAGGLAHKHIVPVYAVGQEDGISFYAMRLIDGQPLSAIIEDLRRQQAPLTGAHYRRAAEWARQVAEALDYAHRHGVIHRDIKPSNILIDEQGQAWVTDFGLARQQTAATITLTSDVIGTVRYMSPEQARGGSLLDERTDHYSLGVTLYELVTLQPPFGGSDYESALRGVLLEEPTPVRRLNVHVPRALAAIIQRAMEKNPERRHPSAAVLAEDLRRFLAGEPLLTQAPGAGARLARLVRRHTVAFAFVSAVFLLVIGFGAWMAVLYARADELARIAQAQERAAVAAQEAEGAARLRAESEASKAKQVQAFLEEMLASVDPSVAQMRDTTLLRELLDNASARVERELAQQPEAAAAVHTTIGLTFKAMGLLDEASPHLAAALDIRRGALGADHVDSRASLLNWADLVYARGELAEAERLVRDAMAQCRAATGPESVESVAARLKLVEVLGDLGRLDEAERLCRQALEVCRRHGRAMDGNRPAALNNLATLVAQRGAFDEAEDLMREALDVTRERVGDVHRDTLLVMSNLASVLRRAGKLDECERLTRTALETRRKLLGEKHPDTLISTVNFAQLLQQQKRFDEAEPLVRRALMLFRETLGDRHQYTLVTRYNLAGLLKDAGRFDEAIDVAEQAASAYEEVFGPDHADTLDSMLHLARCLADGGRLERARDVLESALQRANAAATIEPALMGRIESQLGATLLGLGEFVRAEPLLLSADRLLTAGLGAEERQTIWNVEWLVELYERQEREDQAQRWRAKLPRSQPPESP